MTDSGETKLDVRERGANQQTSERRLWMQLQVWTGVADGKGVVRAVEASRAEAVVYADVGDPRGVGVLALSEDPAFFVGPWREVLGAEPFASLALRHELTMFGRTYASGFETDLEDWLLRRPRRTVMDPLHAWGVWYPLRRTGAFSRLDGREQGQILREHGAIGRAYGDLDLAHDVRLACHGVDAHDNDFVIGLVGRDLHPLSHLVQSMRRTVQTSQYIEAMGPFFVGRALWRSASVR